MSDEDRDGADDAAEEETLVPHESDPETEDEFSPFEEVFDDFLAEPIVRVIADDGMPAAISTGKYHNDIPPLSTKTLICMGDFSKFALRAIFGDAMAEFSPEEVQRSPEGRWRVPRAVARERLALELKRTREAIKKHPTSSQQAQLADLDDDELMNVVLMQSAQGRNMTYAVSREWIEVEPIRPPCRHYVRQITQFDYNPEADVTLRLCAARRTTEGAFMSVRDRKMTACDMREPRHMESETVLDDFDNRKIREGASRTYHSMFEGYGSGKPDGTVPPIVYDRSDA